MEGDFIGSRGLRLEARVLSWSQPGEREQDVRPKIRASNVSQGNRILFSTVERSCVGNVAS